MVGLARNEWGVDVAHNRSTQTGTGATSRAGFGNAGNKCVYVQAAWTAPVASVATRDCSSIGDLSPERYGRSCPAPRACMSISASIFERGMASSANHGLGVQVVPRPLGLSRIRRRRQGHRREGRGLVKQAKHESPRGNSTSLLGFDRASLPVLVLVRRLLVADAHELPSSGAATPAYERSEPRQRRRAGLRGCYRRPPRIALPDRPTVRRRLDTGAAGLRTRC